MDQDYIYYPLKDSPSGDICWAGNKTIPELKKICNENSQCIAFNTLGYLKHSLVDESKFITLSHPHGLYINKKRFQDLINKKVKNIMESKMDITFVITTCKRLPLFIRTMNQLLMYCQDLQIIKHWICIDDNSSTKDRMKMKELFPFFHFINKDESQKGHPESINIFLNTVKTKYVFLFEDDWVCSTTFYIRPYIELLENNEQNLDQIILCQRYGEHPELPLTLNQKKVFLYQYNPYHKVKPELNISYDKSVDKWDNKERTEEGWWWPGISYNPSIWKMERFLEVGEVRTNLRPEIFEYDHALECNEVGLRVAFTDLDIGHIGYDNSAYKKNGYPRYYEI